MSEQTPPVEEEIPVQPLDQDNENEVQDEEAAQEEGK